MSDSAENRPQTTTDVIEPAANFFSVGSELLTEVQHVIGNSRVKSVRVRVADHIIREIPIAPLTAIATIALVIGAILVTNLKIEVVKEPLPELESAATS